MRLKKLSIDCQSHERYLQMMNLKNLQVKNIFDLLDEDMTKNK